MILGLPVDRHRIGAGAKPTSGIFADVDLFVSSRVMQCLGIGINRNEFDVFDAGIDHAIDGGATGAADTNHFNLCERFNCWFNDLRHVTLLPSLYVHSIPCHGAVVQ